MKGHDDVHYKDFKRVEISLLEFRKGRSLDIITWTCTRPRSQLEAAHHQHSMLRQHLRQAVNVCLHTSLGVGGTIYSPYCLEPL